MFSCLMVYLRSFLMPLRHAGGQTLVEYALIIALIVIACVVALGLYSGALLDLYDWIVSQLPFGAL